MTTADLMRPGRSAGEPNAEHAPLEAMSVAPLWSHQGELMSDEPKKRAVPHLWSYTGLRQQVMCLGETLSVPDVERRVLMLVNPALQDPPATVSTLFAGVQLLMPGERVRFRRCTAATLRFVVEGSGTYSTINGEVVPIGPADLVLTPGRYWYEHLHPGAAPIVWIDGVNCPGVNALDAGFVEPDTRGSQSVPAPVSYPPRPLRGRLNPAWWRPPTGASHILNYPWIETERELAKRADAGGGSLVDGIQLEYTNPFVGGPVLPTISCKVSLLHAGFDGVPRQHTASTIYHVVRGSGGTEVDGVRLNWADKDIFAVPGWSLYRHHASPHGDAVLFSYSDEPTLRALGLYRDRWVTG